MILAVAALKPRYSPHYAVDNAGENPLPRLRRVLPRLCGGEPPSPGFAGYSPDYAGENPPPPASPGTPPTRRGRGPLPGWRVYCWTSITSLEGPVRTYARKQDARDRPRPHVRTPSKSPTWRASRSIVRRGRRSVEPL